MNTSTSHHSDPRLSRRDKDAPGRGAAVIIYGLYLGAIMSVVTLPLGALVAHYKLGRGAAWVDSHLRFQIMTFWLMLLASAAAVVVWQLLGWLAVPPITAWSFGYLYITAAIAWYIGRCGVGIHRLTANEPIARPNRLLFG
ncbi:hypothetical protein Q6D67_02105 [Haliea sp. E1-2-M8]|uniref:DUF4870 family protein n=1 Tax=Haliea sp. E1-2-M8 TaxID=3064706 RepID=UPI002727EFE6|nr:hypothetical protein [Haliea sp. E1-2-M8]MDO8860479.1 hypothetical protein [Haliea sp. E1-2-M8]